MKKTVCFGEIMMRLNPKGYLRLNQAKELEVSYAGGEANVAVSLANFNMPVSYVTKLPDNEIGRTVERQLRGFSVDVSDVLYCKDRLGIYFVEKGASQRPSAVIYDRRNSAISKAGVNDFDWSVIFSDADWFHFTGITPALGANLPRICMDACRKAKEMGLTVSSDINYRKNLWSQDEAEKVMSRLFEYVDVCIGNEEDAEKVFGIKAQGTDVEKGSLNHERYIEVAKKIKERFGCKKVAITLRGSISASDNEWAGMLFDEGNAYFSKKYLIHIVDRVGGGDSFGAGLIYALKSGYSQQKAIDFAAAASCLKQTIEFDFNMSSINEVNNLMSGMGSGRIQR